MTPCKPALMFPPNGDVIPYPKNMLAWLEM